MIYLILAVGSSLAIGMIFKHTAQRTDRVALLTVNYAAATAVAVGLLALGVERAAGPLTLEPGLLLLGTATGALFIGAFFVFAFATQVAGLSLAIGVMRISVVIPFLASWVIWDEVPSAAQGMGLALAGAAFFLIAYRPAPPAGQAPPGGAPTRVLAVLAILFFAGGAVDVLLKTFDEGFAADNSRATFLLLVFGVAMVIGLGLVLANGLRTGRWPGRATYGWGVLLGVVNYGSAEFILRAIEQLSGPFVFPANNIALVIGGALLGVLIWGERLAPMNWFGLAMAAAALMLLGL